MLASDWSELGSVFCSVIGAEMFFSYLWMESPVSVEKLYCGFAISKDCCIIHFKRDKKKIEAETEPTVNNT